MNKVTKSGLIVSALVLGGLIAQAGEDRYRTISSNGEYESADGSFASIPAGAYVLAEASAANSTASAYAAAWGGGVNASIYVSNYLGGDDDGFTSYADTVSYSLWVNGLGYALVDIEWGY